MKLVILGAAGQVGRELGRLVLPAGWQAAWFDRVDFDIADAAAVRATLARERPDIVINAAAYTAVDRAEREPEAAWAANAVAPGLIAAACADRGAALIHLSTDYVFDGTKTGAYHEDDPVNPLGVYGKSKAAGEQAVRDGLREHVTIRTAWLYSVHGQNFVRTILRLAEERPSLRVVADQHGAPTAAADLAAGVLAVARHIDRGRGAWGTFHLTGAEPTTWHGFAEAIVALAAPHTGKSPPVEPIATADYPTPARRPANSVLDCSRIGKAYGIVPRPWREALPPVIAELFDKSP
jgi:dTDP-4-dehydrorhamnose reductase